MWLSTLAAMDEELVSDSLVYRYNPSASPDGLRGSEGTFTLCSFWYVDALARSGYLEEAQLTFEKMLTYANHLGLYAEEIGLTGEQLGNFPQAFSHLSLINAAMNLDYQLDHGSGVVDPVIGKGRRPPDRTGPTATCRVRAHDDRTTHENEGDGRWWRTEAQERLERGRPGDLRDHRRPGTRDDVPVVVPARAARAARLPDRGGRGGRLDDRPARRARPHVDRRHRRTARRCGLRPVRRSAQLRAGRLRRRRDLRARRRGARRREDARVLPGDPAQPVRHGREGTRGCRADRARPGRHREAVRPRPEVGAGPRRRTAPVHRRVADLQDRPLPRQDGPRGDPLPPLRATRCSSPCGTATTSTACRSRWPRTSASRDRGHFYDPVGALRDVVVNHLMQVFAAVAMEAPAHGDTRHDQGPPDDAVPRDARSGPQALRARPVRRVSRGRRRRGRLHHRDVLRPATRGRELALVGGAVLHPHRQAPACDPDRGAAGLQALAEPRLRVA